ncbi:hypothetical protein JOC37_000567 [Desulfohalotomaculum tongense]|uniref:hypothetical protein n=1 Tax=Desulforadius tongensis TaxID=1216062 RepID=UPI001958A9DC|nr:hypothetical protein [Desulforadius tongensis]MBM7854194.1 hypothetical protein [Desulforadius tongensis]
MGLGDFTYINQLVNITIPQISKSMNKTDMKVLIELLTNSESLYKDIHPLEKINFSTDNENLFLSEDEKKNFKQLEEKIEGIRSELLNNLEDSHLQDLINQLEENCNNINALSMCAVFREGMLNGFRLGQFFLQGTLEPLANLRKVKI